MNIVEAEQLKNRIEHIQFDLFKLYQDTSCTPTITISIDVIKVVDGKGNVLSASNAESAVRAIQALS